MRRVGLKALLLLSIASVAAAVGLPARAAALVAAPEETGADRAELAGKALIGQRAPTLKLRTIDGKIIDLAKLYGHKPVYVKFWATWCVYCLEQMPHFERTFETLGGDVQVIAVNTNFNETPQRIADYRDRHGLKMPIVVDDGRLASALNLRVTPQHVLIGRDGRVTYVGHLADAKLDIALADLRVQAPATASAGGRVLKPVLARPPATIRTLAGTAFPLHDPAGGRVTALVFFSPWCESYLKKTLPASSIACQSAREQSEALSAKAGVRWLGVSSGLWTNAAELKAYQAKYRVTIPLALDTTGDLFRAYKVTQAPTVVLLGQDGREIRRMAGTMGDLAPLVGRTRP